MWRTVRALGMALAGALAGMSMVFAFTSRPATSLVAVTATLGAVLWLSFWQATRH
jgi:hypothetical protein